MLPETRYSYSVARVRVAELNMLSKDRLERMLEADSLAGVLSVLYEAGYPEKANYEEMLKESTTNLYSYMKEISPEPELFNIFAYRYDSHNIKVLLKSEITGKENREILVDNGVFDKGALEIMIRERDMGNLPREFSKAVLTSIDIYARSKDPQSIDIIVDSAYFSLMKRLAEAFESPFLLKLSKMIIDITNINAFVRIKAKMEDLDLLTKVLTDGGFIKLKRFFDAFGSDIEAFKNELKGSGYTGLIDLFIEEKGSVTEFEKQCDDFITGYLQSFKNKAFGIEPLIGYMLGKETDIKNARIILVGKTNRIDSDIIRDRLRRSYV